MDAFGQALGRLPGGRILDVATGQGGFVHALVELVPGYDEIVGIDTKDRAVEAAQKAFEQPNIRFVQMDAAQMDFDDAHFDAVCIANSLHHMADLPAVLSEMQRVLKPGGHLVIIEMYRDNQTEAQLTHVELHHWWGDVDRAMGVSHNETYTRQQIVDLMEYLSLREVAFYDYADLDADPKAEETVQYLDQVIDMYIQRAEGAENKDALRQRGDMLRERVHRIGYHSATTLIAVGCKS